MIKMLIALGLVSCAGSAPAQFIITGQASSTGSPIGSVLPQIQPIGGGLGIFDNTITPTMRREREERANIVREFIAAAPEKWTSSNPRTAQRLYAKAEHEAKWSRIDARRREM